MKKFILITALLVPLFLNLYGQTKKQPVKSAPKAVLVAPARANADFNSSLVRGKVVYSNSCLPCHQADGGGVSNLNPPLIKTTYVLGDKTKLIAILLKGLNQEIEIGGEIYSNPMPAHDFLTDLQIADVLTYVRNNFGNKASAITPAQVKAVRK